MDVIPTPDQWHALIEQLLTVEAERDEARAKRDEWQRELSHETQLRCRHAAEAVSASAERDSARALLRECDEELYLLDQGPWVVSLRARIKEELGDEA